MDLNTVLRNAQNPNHDIRATAEAQLSEAVEHQYGGFMMALCGELATEGTPDGNRQLAGLFLKNLITAQDRGILESKTRKWFDCDEATKDQLRAGFLQALQSPVKTVSHTAAQVVAAYGAVDLQLGRWPGLLPSLLHNVNSADVSLSSKVSTLEAIGYMCGDMDADRVPPEVVNQLLTTIVSGMTASQPTELRCAAVGAMLNSLQFTEHNFEVPNERNAIMQAICDATQIPDVSARVKAFECLSTIGCLYYEKLKDYIGAIFQLTAAAIKADDHLVGQNAIEFWSNVAEEESDLTDEIAEQPDNPPVLLNLTASAAPTLVPILLDSLSKQQDESADSDEDWNISLAAASCLEKMTLLLGDTMVDPIVGFVAQNIGNVDWRMREAAVMAFACCLDGSSDQKMASIIASGLPALLSCLGDRTPLIRDTTTWTIGRVFDFHPGAIPKELLPTVVQGLLSTLDDRNPRIAEQAALALHRMGGACEDTANDATNILSSYFEAILHKLFATSVRPDADEGNLRTTAHEAIDVVIRHSALDKQPVTAQAMAEVLNRLEAALQITGDPQDRMTLQSLLCATLGVCVQKLPKELVAPSADRIMALLLQVFSSKGGIAHEDAFITSGYFADKIGADFIRYMTHFHGALIAGLQNIHEPAVVIMASGMVGDLSRGLGKNLAPYCESILQQLLQLLKSDAVHRSVKPHVISAFGDIAMAIEGDFVNFLPYIMATLQQASMVDIDESMDEDLIEYINTLRESILVAFAGILQGLKGGDKQETIAPHLDPMIDFIRRCVLDPLKSTDVLKAVIALVGDLVDCFEGRMAGVLQQPFIAQMLNEGKQHDDMRVIWTWANKLIMQHSRK